ncbi:MAG: hypothetical protein ABSE80_10980 [Halobacteriota archaeon]
MATPTIQRAQTTYIGGDYEQHLAGIQYDNVTIFYLHADNP